MTYSKSDSVLGVIQMAAFTVQINVHTLEGSVDRLTASCHSMACIIAVSGSLQRTPRGPPPTDPWYWNWLVYHWLYSLHQLYIRGTLFGIVSCFLAHSFAPAYRKATPPQKQNVPTILSDRRKESGKKQGKLGGSMNLWVEKETETVSFSKETFSKELVPLFVEQTTSSPSSSFLFLPILFSLPYSTIILIMFRQLNMPALTTAQIWGNWLICTIINVGLSP